MLPCYYFLLWGLLLFTFRRKFCFSQQKIAAVYFSLLCVNEGGGGMERFTSCASETFFSKRTCQSYWCFRTYYSNGVQGINVVRRISPPYICKNVILHRIFKSVEVPKYLTLTVLPLAISNYYNVLKEINIYTYFYTSLDVNTFLILFWPNMANLVIENSSDSHLRIWWKWRRGVLYSVEWCVYSGVSEQVTTHCLNWGFNS